VYKLDFFLIRGLLVNFMNVIKPQNKNSTNCYHIWLEQRIYVSIKKYFFTPRKLASPNLNEFTVLYNSLCFKIILHSYFTTLNFDICFTPTHLHHMIFNYEILCCSFSRVKSSQGFRSMTYFLHSWYSQSDKIVR
jgi:hypothetical protein